MQKRAVVLDPEEKKAIGLMQQIQAVQKVKLAKRLDKKNEARAGRAQKLAKEDEKRQDREKGKKKEHFRELGKEIKRKAQSEASGGRANKKRRT